MNANICLPASKKLKLSIKQHNNMQTNKHPLRTRIQVINVFAIFTTKTTRNSVKLKSKIHKCWNLACRQNILKTKTNESSTIRSNLKQFAIKIREKRNDD